MAKAVLLAASLLLAGFAGCIQSPQDAGAIESASTSPIVAQLGAVRAPTENVTANGTWFVVPATVRPEGGLTAFEWTIPSGALVPWGFNKVARMEKETVALEVALLGEPAVDTWGVVFFTEGKEGLEAGGGYLSIASHSVLYSSTREMPIEPETRSTDFFSLGPEVEEGQLMRGLLIVRGPAVADAAVAFRVLDHDPAYPDSDEEPAETPSSFVSARQGVAPILLPARVDARGFELHGYFDVLLGGFTPAEPMWGLEGTVGHPTYQWNVGPRARTLGGPQSFAGSVSSTLSHGFDVVGAGYFSVANSRTSYAADIVIQDRAHSASGTDIELGLIGLLAGMPMAGGGAFGMSDGDGDTSASLTVDRVMVGALFAATDFILLEFGADIQELFGVAVAADEGAADNGALLPTTHLSPRGLVRISPHGGQWTYALSGFGALQNI